MTVSCNDGLAPNDDLAQAAVRILETAEPALKVRLSQETAAAWRAGRIAEVGTHAELIARGGQYAELERIQREGAQASDFDGLEATP